jgi:hypothetical protein
VELLHHTLPDFRAFDFSLSLFLKMELDAINNLFNHVDTDRSLLARSFQTVEDFQAVERFPSGILLHNQWEGILCPFARSKSFMAAKAFPSTPNGVFIFSQAGIDDLTLEMTTERTFH